MVDDGLELKYVSDEDSAPARRRARRPHNHRGTATSGSGVNQFNLLLEAAIKTGTANRTHPDQDSPGEQRMFPGIVPVLQGDPIDDWVAVEGNNTKEYRRLKIDDDITYPRENLVSAGGGQYMNTAVHLNIAQHALKQVTGRDYSKAAVMAMLVARAVAPVADLIERAVWEDRHGNLMPTQGRVRREQFKADFHALNLNDPKNLRWRLVFNTERPDNVPGGPLFHEDWMKVAKGIFGNWPDPPPFEDEEPEPLT
ncbi:hypothetical protein ACK3TF_006090 [Chlorella vulgaris]